MPDDSAIAIVGMAGRFPGAPNLEQFWANLAGGVESIVRLSDHELRAAGVPAATLRDARYVKAAAVLDAPGRFEAAFFGLTPAEAAATDPQHRVLLELAYEALESAGYDPRRVPGRVGVFAGTAWNGYVFASGLHRRIADDYIPTLIGNDKDFAATRISYKLDLSGPSVTVQTACSTSLVAVHLACQSLRSGESDVALAGAASVRVPHRVGYFCDGGGIESPDGHVRAFDAAADGTVFGSGAGLVVLKRLADALADGDPIRALILGSAVNNDGAAKAGYTAPSVDRQAEAVVEALANADVDAGDISYVEAHGSGTPVGDPIEIHALARAFETMTRRRGYCAVGSVKPNVGHLDAAAAIAGLIKTVLALEHRRLPKSLNFRTPNPAIDFANTAFYVNAELREWTGDRPRRAVVVATGMGGTNGCLVLGEAPPREAPANQAGPHLLPLSAPTSEALDGAVERLRTFLRANPAPDIADIAYTLQRGRAAMRERRVLVCTGRDDAIEALGERASARAASGRASDARRPIVLLLPGLGDHYVGMGAGLYDAWPVFRREIDRCAGILQAHLDTDIRTVLYPSTRLRECNGERRGIDLGRMLGRDGSGTDDLADGALARTLFAQAALFTVEFATARLWQSLGVAFDAIACHSMGEYVAACLAGVMSLEDALALVAARARLVEALPAGAMLAVALTEEELRPLLGNGVSLSLVNGPRLCVVAGSDDAVTRFERDIEARGALARRVRNGHAFHTDLLAPIVPGLATAARRVPLRRPAIPYTSNVTGTWVSAADATDPEYWGRHATRPARFDGALAEVWRLDDPILVEAGPGRTLGVLAMQHPARGGRGGGGPVASMRAPYEHRPDDEMFRLAAGRLWTLGVDLDWDAMPPGRRRRVAMPGHRFEGDVHWRVENAGPDPAPTAGAVTAPGETPVRKIPDPAAWIHAPTWTRLLPAAAHASGDATTGDDAWLIFADDSAPATALLATLRRAGHRVTTVRAGDAFRRVDARTFTIDPARGADYERLMAQALARSRDARLVHAWTLSAPPAIDAEHDSFAEAQAAGFHSLLHLARAAAALGSRDLSLFVLSSGVHDVAGDEALYPERATLLAPCMTIGQEYPHIRVRQIDIEAPVGDTATERAAVELAAELALRDGPPVVAHRRGHRWTPGYAPVRPAEGSAVPPILRDHGVYLITGGAGAVGSAIAEFLAERYRARLVLVGRLPVPPQNEWPAAGDDAHPDTGDPIAARVRLLRRIELLGGQALYCCADVGDARRMREVVADARSRFGGLDGVVHAAGIVGDDREIADCTPASSDAHFAGKARGVQALAAALEGEPLEFCLLMSSLTSVLGGVGQSAYAAANLYLDAYARRQRRQGGSPWLSVNWDVWRVGGASAGAAGARTTLRELGMNRAEATETLERVLAMRGAGQLVVSTGDLDARISQWLDRRSLRPDRPAGAPASPRAPRPDLQTAFAPPGDDTERRVAAIWGDTLGIDAVGTDDTFADLGGHSLLAVRIVGRVREAFGLQLPVRVLFDAPTVGALARLIRERIAAEVASLTDEEVERLAARE